MGPPCARNTMKIASFNISFVGIVLMALVLLSGAAVAEEFNVGVYYYTQDISQDNFGFDFGLMELARNGCNRIVVAGNTSGNFWATVKNWQMEGITAYDILNGVGDNPVIDTEVITGIIEAERRWADLMYYGSEYVGDAIIGKMVTDEPEAYNRTEAQKNYIRAYCDIYRQVNPTRKTFINHANIPWYDLDEDEPTHSTGPTIEYNHTRISDVLAEAQRLGYANFTAVAQTAKISVWMNTNCGNLLYYGFGPCTQEQFDWLESRTVYQDVFDEIVTPFLYGANGVNIFLFNAYNVSNWSYYSLVDPDGKDHNWRMTAFGDAVRYIRQEQGRPEVELFRRVTPLDLRAIHDFRKYPAGTMTIQANVTAGSVSVSRVVFGKSTDGGATWQTVQDNSFPFYTSYTLNAGETVILRAQAVDVEGHTSIYDAKWIEIVSQQDIRCGDYESATISSDLNKDCRVDINDYVLFSKNWLECDDPAGTNCFGPPPIRVEAESMTITPVSAAGLVQNPGWSSGDVVTWASDIHGGGVQFATGYLKLNVPVALPDGEYLLKARWNVNNYQNGAQYHFLLWRENGSLVENGGSGAGAWHTFYPNANGVTEDYLAGPSFTYPVWENSPVGSSITVSGIGAGDFILYLMDDSAGSFSCMDLDWIEFEPISDLPSSPADWYCGQLGSGFPGLPEDLNRDCYIDILDLTLFLEKWMNCDDPQLYNQ